MSTLTAGASRSTGREVCWSNTPARLPVQSRSRVKTRVRHPVPEPGRGIGAGSGAEGVGALLDDRQHVGDGGLGRGEPVIEQVDGAAEDDFLGVGDGRAADQRAQSHQQGQAAGADLPPQRRPVGAAHLPQRGTQGAGRFERVDPVHAAADADHLAAEMLDQHACSPAWCRRGQGPWCRRHGSGQLPFDQGGLADSRLAEDELAGVSDQSGPQPGQWVQAHHLAEQLMPSHRGADGRGAGAAVNGNSPQTWAVVAGIPVPRRRARRGRRRGSSIPTEAGPVPGAPGDRRRALAGGQPAGWPGRAGRVERAGYGDVMTAPGASGASGGPARRGRSRMGGWWPIRRPG